MLRAGLAAIAMVLSTSASDAAQVSSYWVGNWFVGAYTDDTTGQFSSCTATTRYNSGIDLVVYVSRDFLWDLGFASSSWKMTPGERISVQYRFDRSAWAGATVDAVSENLVRMPMPSNGQIAGLFRRSRVMEVTDGNQSFYFNLDGTSRLLVSLVQCVQNGLNAEQSVAVPAPLSNTEEPNVAALRLEGTRVLSNFLLAADLPGAQLLEETAFPSELAFAHAVAVAGGSVGFSLVFTNPEKSADAIAAELSGMVSQDCQGKFGSGSTKETMDGLRMVSAFTACASEAGSEYFQYVVVARKPAGQYVIGLMSDVTGTSDGKLDAQSAPVSPERIVKAAFKVSQ